MFTDGLLPANDNHLAEAIYFFVSLIGINVDVMGIIFNIINVVVFTKQQSSESMTVTLLGLALSDLGSLSASIVNNAFVNPLFIQNEVPLEPLEVMYPVSSLPRLCFSRVSMWLVIFASFERCLCVAMPLKVKVIMTKTRAQTFVVFSFVFAFALFTPMFATVRLGWKFSESRNRTLVGLVFKSDFSHTHYILSVTIGVVTFASFALLVILTVVLIVRLNQKSKWRAEHSSSGSDRSFVSRDQKLVKMIVIIDTILIACYIPSVVINLLSSAIPAFSFMGTHESLFFTCWKTAFVLESVNSSINIFVYYNMSSNFKAEMQKLFPFLLKDSGK